MIDSLNVLDRYLLERTMNPIIFGSINLVLFGDLLHTVNI